MSDIGNDGDGEEGRTGALQLIKDPVSRAAANGQLFKLKREAGDGTHTVSYFK
jgi:hypothetical protein